MALPFLSDKKKSVASVIIQKTRTPDAEIAAKEENPESNQELEAVCQDILSAISRQDARSLAESLQAAFAICDAQPHAEGEDTNSDEDYDAQNIKAAQRMKADRS